jgi:uncharacterized membrane protein YczE
MREGSPILLTMWRPTPARLARLLVGTTLFGAGEACVVAGDLGNSAWSVLAQGVSLQTPLSVGTATVAISFAVLLLWIPLRQLPGLGTMVNAVGIGLALDATLHILPTDPGLGLGLLLVTAGIALIALGSGFYLTAALGPGPRDGLMTGLNRRTGVSLRLARAAIEISVLVATDRNLYAMKLSGARLRDVGDVVLKAPLDQAGLYQGKKTLSSRGRRP